MSIGPPWHVYPNIPPNFYRPVYNPMISGTKPPERQKFTKNEDDMLENLVKEHGENNWNLISRYFLNRKPRQCRERYINHLRPEITKSPWTKEEEALLAQKYKEIGPKWNSISLSFPNRSDSNIKNHWAVMVGRIRRQTDADLAKLSNDTQEKEIKVQFNQEQDLPLDLSPDDFPQLQMEEDPYKHWEADTNDTWFEQFYDNNEDF